MITRYEHNPIIKPEDVKPSIEGYKVVGAFNPGATRFGDEIMLLVRIAESCEPEAGSVRVPVYRFERDGAHPAIQEFRIDECEQSDDTRVVFCNGRTYLTSLSHIRLARSRDGIHFKVDTEPFIYPIDESEEYGVEDARVTFVDGKYYITYTAISGDSWATALAVTEDFKNVERKGIIFHPENKDVAIFPEKVNGMYVALNRPNNTLFGKPSIWYSESPDLIHWGNHRCILRPRHGNRWEAQRIGAGAPPIKTARGWLVICHGKGDTGAYSLFCVLLDLEKPYKVLKQSSEPLMVPEEHYETNGFFPNVVFSNGVVERDGKLFVYYGASDDTTNVAITDIESLLEHLDDSC